MILQWKDWNSILWPLKCRSNRFFQFILKKRSKQADFLVVEFEWFHERILWFMDNKGIDGLQIFKIDQTNKSTPELNLPRLIFPPEFIVFIGVLRKGGRWGRLNKWDLYCSSNVSLKKSRSILRLIVLAKKCKKIALYKVSDVTYPIYSNEWKVS